MVHFCVCFSNLHKVQIKVGGWVEKYWLWHVTIYFTVNENACVSHLPRVFGVENTNNNFDLDPMALAIFTLTLMTLDHKIMKSGFFTF